MAIGTAEGDRVDQLFLFVQEEQTKNLPDEIDKIHPLPQIDFPNSTLLSELVDLQYSEAKNNRFKPSPEFTKYLDSIDKLGMEEKYWGGFREAIILSVGYLRYAAVDTGDGPIPWPNQDELTVGDARKIVKTSLHLRLNRINGKHANIVEQVFKS